MCADVTASIHYISEHVLGSFGITRGHFACLFSFTEVRTSKLERSRFSKTLPVWTRIFFHTDEIEFFKTAGFLWTRPIITHKYQKKYFSNQVPKSIKSQMPTQNYQMDPPAYAVRSSSGALSLCRPSLDFITPFIKLRSPQTMFPFVFT